MSLWFVGRRGTYAEYVVLDEGAATATPANLDDVTAATIPLNALTAWSALAASRLEAGQRLLVTGAAGAVGGYLVELGVARGIEVVALGRPHDADTIRSFGAHEVIDDVAKCAPVDIAVDTTANPTPYVAAVRPGGRLLTLAGRVDGDTGEVTVKGIGVRNDAEALGTIASMASAGKLTTRVAGTHPFEAVADAHRLMAAGGVRGRLVLVP
jgi:NADPH:quinone reductase-like Zn-dependent oxidoreductase